MRVKAARHGLAEPSRMTARQIARKHFTAALAEAEASGIDADALARYTLSLVVESFLAHRPLEDVRAELIAAAENADPDTDYMFMRP
jgi:hypothetical protein